MELYHSLGLLLKYTLVVPQINARVLHTFWQQYLDITRITASLHDLTILVVPQNANCT